jgi:putative ATP-dependent endonuclease of OLD family
LRIEKVYIKNFRCLRSVETTLDNLTVLVGRNGSGKSAVLHAIDVLFTPGANITEEDFFGRNTDESIEIEITFKDFTLEERVEFGAYIQDNKMRVIKIISYDKESNTSREEYFSFKTQIPSFAKIRELPGARDKTNALKELIAQGSLPSLEGNPRSESETLEIMESYEASHPELTELVKIKPHFFGARNIGGGKLDKYTKFIFLPAVKEVSEEVTGKDSSIDCLRSWFLKKWKLDLIL